MDNPYYRALKADGGGWIYGMPTYDLKYVFDDSNVDSPDNYEVIPKTIGQYTGFKDENGSMVFVGDKFNPISKNLTYVVVFKEAQFGLESELGYWGSLKRYYELAERHNWSYEVIGNIHESDGTNLQ